MNMSDHGLLKSRAEVDTSITEKLDYFSAALAILYSLYFSIMRLFHLYPINSSDRITNVTANLPRRRQLSRLWAVSCTVVYTAHVSYLTLLPRFDYTYNIIFNVVLGMLHNLLWLAFALPSSVSLLRRFASQPKNYRPKYVGDAARAVILTTAATCLELFDFSPWYRVIDAHSLWHLATAPLVVLWYDFLIVDAQDIGWREQRS